MFKKLQSALVIRTLFVPLCFSEKNVLLTSGSYKCSYSQRNHLVFWKSVLMSRVLITRFSYDVLISRVFITRVDCISVKYTGPTVTNQSLFGPFSLYQKTYRNASEMSIRYVLGYLKNVTNWMYFGMFFRWHSVCFFRHRFGLFSDGVRDVFQVCQFPSKNVPNTLWKRAEVFIIVPKAYQIPIPHYNPLSNNKWMVIAYLLLLLLTDRYSNALPNKCSVNRLTKENGAS